MKQHNGEGHHQSQKLHCRLLGNALRAKSQSPGAIRFASTASTGSVVLRMIDLALMLNHLPSDPFAQLPQAVAILVF